MNASVTVEDFIGLQKKTWDVTRGGGIHAVAARRGVDVEYLPAPPRSWRLTGDPAAIAAVIAECWGAVPPVAREERPVQVVEPVEHFHVGACDGSMARDLITPGMPREQAIAYGAELARFLNGVLGQACQVFAIRGAGASCAELPCDFDDEYVLEDEISAAGDNAVSYVDIDPTDNPSRVTG